MRTQLAVVPPLDDTDETPPEEINPTPEQGGDSPLDAAPEELPAPPTTTPARSSGDTQPAFYPPPTAPKEPVETILEGGERAAEGEHAVHLETFVAEPQYDAAPSSGDESLVQEPPDHMAARAGDALPRRASDEELELPGAIRTNDRPCPVPLATVTDLRQAPPPAELNLSYTDSSKEDEGIIDALLRGSIVPLPVAFVLLVFVTLIGGLAMYSNVRTLRMDLASTTAALVKSQEDVRALREQLAPHLQELSIQEALHPTSGSSRRGAFLATPGGLIVGFARPLPYEKLTPSERTELYAFDRLTFVRNVREAFVTEDDRRTNNEHLLRLLDPSATGVVPQQK